MKKFLAILGMITCIIGLTACGSSQEATAGSISEEQALESGAKIVDSLWQSVSSGGVEQYADDKVLYNGLLNFQSALEDIGNYIGTDGGTVEFKKDEIIVSINVLGSGHNAVTEIVCDENLWIISISTNVAYSTAEKMGKAALNTLLGMGTVFVILILISLIISAFGLVPKLFAPKTKEPEKAQAQNTDRVVTQVVESEELNDDLELVAVISAAVAAYEGSGSTDGFVVRSIRKAYKK